MELKRGLNKIFGAGNRIGQLNRAILMLRCAAVRIGADVRPSAHLALYCLGLAKPETQVTARERECLLEHAAGTKLAAEIGVWHGVTTSVLRKVMDATGTIYAIDPFPAGRMGFSIQRWIASREIRKANGAEVRFLRLTGVDSAKRFLSEGILNFDFVFIDGDHSFDGLRGDWEYWSRLVQAGGCIALHDSRSSASRDIETAGSVRFTKQVILKVAAFEVVSEEETLTVLRRKSVSRAARA
jgi:predicted O-methyltransferase YrrM